MNAKEQHPRGTNGTDDYFDRPQAKSKSEKKVLHRSDHEKQTDPNKTDNQDHSIRVHLKIEEIDDHLHNQRQTDFISPLILDISKEPFFHGCVAAEDTVECLKNEGDFLLRTPLETTTKPGEKLCHLLYISALWKGKVHHFPVSFTKSSEGQVHVYVNSKSKKDSIRDLLKEHKSTPIEQNVMLLQHATRAKWQLPQYSVVLEDKIGEGAFGTVWKGKLRDEKLGDKSVAVKVTRETDASKREDILIEARVMRNFQHINVVQFYGVLVDATQVMIVMELVEGGSLNHYIKKYNKTSDTDRGSFCYDVACGLGYLHSKHFLHRDLASRNCLIDRESNTVKLSDFGMSKQGVTYKISAKERTPIRWQAPEVMKTAIYTIKCDVYSYGMLMYEIFSGGKVPFDGLDNKVIRQKINDPKFRPKQNDDWPVEIRAVMAYCWKGTPEKRPAMECVISVLKIFSKKSKNCPVEAKPAQNKSKEEKPKSRTAQSRKKPTSKEAKAVVRAKRTAVQSTASPRK